MGVTSSLINHPGHFLTHQSDEKCIWPLLLSNCMLLHETFHDYSIHEALSDVFPKMEIHERKNEYCDYFSLSRGNYLSLV